MILFENSVFDKLNKTILSILTHHIIPKYFSMELLNRDNCHKPYMNSSWIVINNYGDHNGYHTHDGTWLSGSFYIKLPSDNKIQRDYASGPIRFWDPIAVRKHEMGLYKPRSVIPYFPGEGELFIFPSWLGHDVASNRTNEDRIVYSFGIPYLQWEPDKRAK